MALRTLLSNRRSISTLLSSLPSRSSFTPVSRSSFLAAGLRDFTTDPGTPPGAAAAGDSTRVEDAGETVMFPRGASERGRRDAQSINPELLLPGCDFKHWLIFMEPPPENTGRDDIINSYVKTLTKVVSSEEEAKMKIYSVSTRHYYAFGCLMAKEDSDKLKNLPGVRWVLPDSYLNPKTKDYGGEPFINGKAVPYDPKYHSIWLQNNQAPDRGRRHDRPRNFDRPRENWQNRDYQSRPRPPMPNQNHEFEKRSGPPIPNQRSQS